MTRSTSLRGPTLRTRRRPGGVFTFAKFGAVFLSFGPAGDPKSRLRFANALAAWEGAGRRVTHDVLAAAGQQEDVDDSIPIRELVEQYERWLDETGRYRKRGEPTNHRLTITRQLEALVEHAGDVTVRSCTDASLIRHRDRLERNPRLTRTGINRAIGYVLGAFKWGYQRGLVPKTTWADLRLVEPMTRAEAGNRRQGYPKRIPTLDEIRAVLPHCSRQVSGMLRVQLATGMRPGEVCSMRFEDVEAVTHNRERFGLYRVRDGKTSHHGREVSYVLSASVLALLDEFRRPGGGVVFRPCDAMRESSIQRRADRQTEITKQTRERDAGPKREFGETYQRSDYHQAIERACKAAGVPKFVPHAVRHVVASWAANNPQLGAGAAAAALGHADRETTSRYVHNDESLRFAVARLADRELAI